MIQVENLTYRYPGQSSLTLKGLSFTIEKGSIFGFLGPSGAGKSTAQKILYKTLPGFGGNVHIDQRDLNAWDSTYFEKIGVGFELPNHYLKLTGKENLALFGSYYPEKKMLPAEDLFKMVGLSDAIDKPVEAYSKGMKMRLNFIRAIQHDPDILFFDEPTSGLDPSNGQLIKSHIQDLKGRGKTIFITTHDMYTADELCDTVAFITDGALKTIEKPEVLKSQFGKKAIEVVLSNGQVYEFPLQDIGHNEAFASLLRNNEILRMHTMEASLEKVFIEITGQALQV